MTENAGLDGTIIFFGAGSGKSFWARDGAGILESHLLQRDLSTGANDFKIVEVEWADFWFHGNNVALYGPAKLACRVATVVEYLLSRENYHHCEDFPEDCTSVCATGQSGGGNQLAYTLTHYGMDESYDGVIFTSGPPYADLELGCSDQCDEDGIPNGMAGCYSVKARWTLDTAYSTPTDPDLRDCVPPPPPYNNIEECGKGEFPDARCVNRKHQPGPGFDQEFADSLPEDSISVETLRWDYDYGLLGISFIFGAPDNGAAKVQGEIYRDVLSVENDVDSVVLDDVEHEVHEDPLGTTEIRMRLADFCGATP